MDKEKIKQKSKSHRQDKELREAVARSKELGLPVRDIPKDKNAMDHLNHMMNSEPMELSALERKGRGKYRLDDKILAIMFLEAFQKDIDGVMTPKFSMVASLLSFPKQTLHDWWKSREDIVSQKSTIVAKGFEYTQVKLMLELMRMTESLSRKNYDDMKDKDLINLLNTIINKVRLLGNLSTSNVEHLHKGGVAMVLPKEEEGDK